MKFSVFLRIWYATCQHSVIVSHFLSKLQTFIYLFHLYNSTVKP